MTTFTQHDEAMKAAGFVRSPRSRFWTNGRVTVRYDAGKLRQWYAERDTNGQLLRASGDMIGSGPVRRFKTPLAAAKAAEQEWYL